MEVRTSCEGQLIMNCQPLRSSIVRCRDARHERQRARLRTEQVEGKTAVFLRVGSRSVGKRCRGGGVRCAIEYRVLGQMHDRCEPAEKQGQRQ